MPSRAALGALAKRTQDGGMRGKCFRRGRRKRHARARALPGNLFANHPCHFARERVHSRGGKLLVTSEHALD